jgi:hypothetical protein
VTTTGVTTTGVTTTGVTTTGATTRIDAVEKAAAAEGAKSMTLHVLATNSRARALYTKSGYDCELLRYVKHM